LAEKYGWDASVMARLTLAQLRVYAREEREQQGVKGMDHGAGFSVINRRRLEM